MRKWSILLVMAALVLWGVAVALSSFEKWRLKRIVLEQSLRYPTMEVDDLFKLIFHAAMGNRHLLLDPEKAKAYLKKEWESVTPSSQEPLIEIVSPDGAWARINLRPFKAKRWALEDLYLVMLLSARQGKESHERMKRYARYLMEFQESGDIHHSSELLRKTMQSLENDPQRVFHHSKKYVQAYRPSYRLVLLDLFERTFLKE